MLPQQLLRHRLDTVDARAEIHAVQVQLEDLFLAEEDLEQHRQHRFLHLATVGANVGEEQRARELLRERAPTLPAADGLEVVEGRARQRDRIDAGMPVEPVVFDGNDRVLDVGGDAIERHILPLFIEAEPRAARGVVKHRVADATVQPVDCPAVAPRPHEDHHHEDDPHRARSGDRPLAPRQLAKPRESHFVTLLISFGA